MVMYWLAIGSDTLVTLLSIASLYEGVRLLTATGPNRKAVLTTLFGLCLCVSWAGINYVKYRSVSTALEVLELRAVPKDLPPPSDWSKSLTASAREELGRAIARDEYFHSGSLTTYIDRTQTTTTFSPTQNEIRDREATVAGLTELRQLQGARFSDLVRWLMLGAFAAFWGYARGRQPKNG